MVVNVSRTTLKTTVVCSTAQVTSWETAPPGGHVVPHPNLEAREQWRHVFVILASGSGKLYVEVRDFPRCIVIELPRTDERPHHNEDVK